MTGSRIHFIGPVVCRSPGLPFDRLTRLAAHPTDAEELATRLEADRRRLWEQLDDPLVVDAFASMNPQTLGNLLATRAKDRHLGKRTSDVKRDERTLFKFLTRFASRNDTTGSAGSTVWGEWVDAPGTAVLTPGPTRHARRVVLTSPRRGAWLWRRVLPTLDPLPGRLSLAGRLQLAPNGVWNTETATLWPLTTTQLDLVRRAIGADAATLPREPVLELLDAGVLTLELRDGVDPLDALARRSTDANVSTLATLKRTLETASGLDAARLVMQAEVTLRELAPFEPLDLGHALELVVRELLEQAPAFVRVVRARRFTPGDESREPVSSSTSRCSAGSCARKESTRCCQRADDSRASSGFPITSSSSCAASRFSSTGRACSASRCSSRNFAKPSAPSRSAAWTPRQPSCG